MKEDHKGSWECPRCGKTHSKPHYKFPDQLDTEKEISEPGKVKYGWEEKNYGDKSAGMSKPEMRCDADKMETGPEFDKKGNPNGMFCPHCGWEQQVEILVKVKAKRKLF